VHKTAERRTCVSLTAVRRGRWIVVLIDAAHAAAVRKACCDKPEAGAARSRLMETAGSTGRVMQKIR